MEVDTNTTDNSRKWTQALHTTDGSRHKYYRQQLELDTNAVDNTWKWINTTDLSWPWTQRRPTRSKKIREESAELDIAEILMMAYAVECNNGIRYDKTDLNLI